MKTMKFYRLTPSGGTMQTTVKLWDGGAEAYNFISRGWRNPTRREAEALMARNGFYTKDTFKKVKARHDNQAC